MQRLSNARQGSLRPGRVLRVAQLYGYLQWRSRSNRDVRVTLRDLGAAWFVQPRLLKADLDDLQTLGWLRFCSDAKGTTVTLMSAATEIEASGPDEQDCASQELLQSLVTSAEIPSTSETQACAVVQPRVIAKTQSEPSAEPKRAPLQSPLIAQFAATYNQHKPETWPAYKPTGTLLASRLRQAIRHAGGAQAFEEALIRALRGMPEFWCTEYPQERSGADCARALLQVDRASEGRGVEHWHIFAWGAYTGRLNGGNGGNTPGVGQGVAPGMQESDLDKANRLLFWNRDHWHGRGIEAAKLDRCEKQRLAELLEAQGEGIPGSAAEQFSQPPRQH
nr:hypothetical protein [Synechococcus sp. HK05]